MADLFVNIPVSDGASSVLAKGAPVVRYKDMGDGTFAPVAYMSIAGANVTVPATMNQGTPGGSAWPVSDATTHTALATGAASTAIAAGAITGVAGRYMGITVRETTGGTATVVLHDSVDNTGVILETVALTAHQSVSIPVPNPGVAVATGIFAVVTGTVEGSVRHL